MRSAYALANLPEGASVPYLPQAQSREHLPPALMDLNDPSMRIGDGGAGGESGQLLPPHICNKTIHFADFVIFTDADHPAKDKPKIVLPAATRASESVTEIPGAGEFMFRRLQFIFLSTCHCRSSHM